MINFFKKKEINSENETISLSKVASLLIHCAKIDENFTEKEEEIIKKTLIELGESVTKGQVIGRIHSLTQIEDPAVEVRAQIDGVLVTRAGRAQVKIWDTIAVIATDLDVSDFETNSTD